MYLDIPEDCDRKRVHLSPSETQTKAIPYDFLQSRFNTYGKIAREDVYSALILMGADGKITKGKIYNLESYFALIHPTNMKPGVRDLVAEMLTKLREELGGEDQIVIEPFPEEFFNSATLDPRLIGTWRYTEYYSSGSFHAQNYTFMEFVPDGTFRVGGQMTASLTHHSPSGAWAGNTSGRSAGGLSEGGEWHTEENTLVLRPRWKAEERLQYQVDHRGLLTQSRRGENKLYLRVSG